jgi:hypothetical protein
LTLENKRPDSRKLASIVDQSCPKQDLAGLKPHSTGGGGQDVEKEKVKDKVSFDELLSKYKREVKQKYASQLGDNTRSQRDSSLVRPNVLPHYRQ